MLLKKRHLIAVFSIAVAGLVALLHQKEKFVHDPIRLTEHAGNKVPSAKNFQTSDELYAETPHTRTAGHDTDAPADLTQQIIIDAMSLHDLRQAIDNNMPPDRRLEHLDFFMQNMGEGQDNLARIAKDLKTTPAALAGVLRNIATDAVKDIHEQLYAGVPDIIDRYALIFAAAQYGHYIGLQADGSIAHTYAQQMSEWDEGELRQQLHQLYGAAEAAAKREFEALPKDNSQISAEQAERFIRSALFSTLSIDPAYDTVAIPDFASKDADNGWMAEFNKRLTDMYMIRDRIAATAAARDHDKPVGDFKP